MQVSLGQQYDDKLNYVLSIQQIICQNINILTESLPVIIELSLYVEFYCSEEDQ